MSTTLASQRVFPNPFRDGIVGDAWESHASNDVESIHQYAFEACMRAVEQVRSTDCNGGLILYGAAGSGKTHVIRRLREHLTSHFSTPQLSQLEQIFAYVRLDTSPHSIARHVRNRVANDLLRCSSKSGPSQFELLVIAGLMNLCEGGGDMLCWWDYYRQERSADMEDAIENLGEQCRLSSNFTRVLTHLVARRHRMDVKAWLLGEPLAIESYNRLGVGMPADDTPEEDALKVLCDFARLAGSHLPLVICFDQVEALQTNQSDTQALYTYGQLVRNLANANQNLLLISCMQVGLFQQLTSLVAEYQTGAMQNFSPISLDPVKLRDANLLLQSRLRMMRAVADWPSDKGELWPLTENDIVGWVGEHGTTPRRLLFKAAEVFDRVLVKGPDSPPPGDRFDEWLSKKWENLYDDAMRERTAKDTTEVLRNGIPNVVSLSDSEWTARSERIPDIEFVFEGPGSEARVGVVLLDNRPVALPHQLRRLSEINLSQKRIQKLVLLRDERLAISKNAATTRQLLDQLQADDAVLHWVSPEAVAAIEAARNLLNAAKVGDLSFEGETVMFESVVDWLRANLPNALKETAEVLLLPATGREFSSTLVERLQEEMQTEFVCSVSALTDKLNTTDEEVRKAAEQRPDLFGYVSGEPATLFSSRLASRCLT